MRYGALLAVMGVLAVTCGLSAADKDAPKPAAKDDQPVVKKDAPAKDAKPEQPVKKPAADAPKKDANPDRPAKKPAADAPAKKPLTAEDKAKLKKDGASQGGGKLEAAAVNGNVLTLKIDGKEYELAIAETRAMVKAAEQDGKQVVFAVQLVNVGAGGKGKDQPAKTKPGADKPDAPKKPADKEPAKTPEKKPE